MNKKIIVLNFKLNGKKKIIKNYIKKIKNNKYNNIKILISPPILYMFYLYKLTKNNNIKITSQNIDIHTKGPYTGEISGKMLKDINTKYVIIGHSERRIHHKEKNKILLKKILITKKLKLKPIICIGENLKEYNLKKSKKVCINQIKYFIKKSNIKILENTIIAYEPIWSIGTGKTANIKHINKIIKCINKYIININKNLKNKFKIIYGGSVNENNYLNIIKQKYINGLLIGKLTLNIKNIIKIIKNLNKNKIKK